jgi:hypothetical protein
MTDFIGRMGADLIAVVMGECEDPSALIDRFVGALNDNSKLESEETPIQVCVAAVKVEVPDRAVTVAELLDLVEDALGPRRGAGLCVQRTLTLRMGHQRLPASG